MKFQKEGKGGKSKIVDIYSHHCLFVCSWSSTHTSFIIRTHFQSIIHLPITHLFPRDQVQDHSEVQDLQTKKKKGGIFIVAWMTCVGEKWRFRLLLSDRFYICWFFFSLQWLDSLSQQFYGLYLSLWLHGGSEWSKTICDVFHFCTFHVVQHTHGMNRTFWSLHSFVTWSLSQRLTSYNRGYQVGTFWSSCRNRHCLFVSLRRVWKYQIWAMVSGPPREQTIRGHCYSSSTQITLLC